MPKVTTEYKIKKKQLIIEAMVEVLQRKPLYEITMLDVIQEAKLSKGGIYLYFSDIDELLIETINYLVEKHSVIEFVKEDLSGDVESDLLMIFQKLGDYMESCPPIISKLRSELVIYITNYPEKTDRYKSTLVLQETGEQFMKMTAWLIQDGIVKKVFRQDINMDVVLMNISVYLDGMSEAVVNSVVYKNGFLQFPIKDYLQQFIQSFIQYLK